MKNQKLKSLLHELAKFEDLTANENGLVSLSSEVAKKIMGAMVAFQRANETCGNSTCTTTNGTCSNNVCTYDGNIIWDRSNDACNNTTCYPGGVP